MKLNLNHWPQR